ncbi:hypothetical protein AB4084_08790 [Lysobacter sp. 2RAB21]
MLEHVLHERVFTGSGDVDAVLDGRKIPGLPERLRATGGEVW